MANKKKESEFKHDHNVMLRLTEEEYEVLKEDALQAKMSVAVFARSVVMQRNVTINYKVVADMEDVRSIGRELHAIGNNLNQVLRKLNILGIAHSLDLEQCQTEIVEIEKLLYRTFRPGKGDD